MLDNVATDDKTTLKSEQTLTYAEENLFADTPEHKKNHRQLVSLFNIVLYLWCGVQFVIEYTTTFTWLTWVTLGMMCCLFLMEAVRLLFSPVTRTGWLVFQGILTLGCIGLAHMGILFESWLLSTLTMRLAIDLPLIPAGINAIVGLLIFSIISSDSLAADSSYQFAVDVLKLVQPAPIILFYLGWLIGTRAQEWKQASRLSTHYKRTAANLANANIRLQEYAADVEMVSSLEERQRVARDVHDTVGHMLTLILVQIRACQTALFARPNDLKEELATAEQAVLSGLKEVRQSVSALRMPRIGRDYGKIRWSKMGRIFEEITHVTVDMDIQEDFTEIHEEIENIVYRVIQEGLTNAYRHGHAPRVRVHVWRSSGFLLIHISDNGRSTDEIHEGNGLRGIRERVEALGGKVGYKYEVNSGFDIGAQIPVEGVGQNGQSAFVNSR